MFYSNNADGGAMWNSYPTKRFKIWSKLFNNSKNPIKKHSILKPLGAAHYSLLYFIKGSQPRAFAPPSIPIETCRHCGGEQKDYGGYKNKMNPKGINITDIWTDIPLIRHKKYKTRDFANELSLKLLDRVIDIGSNEGDLILDPFGGSGTTYVVSELKNRRWLGSEIGPCEIIQERFNNLSRERENIRWYCRNKNKLFTFESIIKRIENGHGFKGYSIDDPTLKK